MSKSTAGRIVELAVGGKTFNCEADIDSQPTLSTATTKPDISFSADELTMSAIKEIFHAASKQKKQNERDVINSIITRYGCKPIQKDIGFGDIVFFVSNCASGIAFKKAIEKTTPIKVFIDECLGDKSVIIKEKSND